MIVLYGIGGAWLFRTFLGSTFAVRVAITSAVLLPPPSLGMFLPTGMQLVR